MNHPSKWFLKFFWNRIFFLIQNGLSQNQEEETQEGKKWKTKEANCTVGEVALKHGGECFFESVFLSALASISFKIAIVLLLPYGSRKKKNVLFSCFFSQLNHVLCSVLGVKVRDRLTSCTEAIPKPISPSHWVNKLNYLHL